MNKVLNILASIIICQITFGQSKTDKITSKIIEEGKMLYKSEMASWYGTDIFIEKFKEKEKIGGYLSYSENEISRCIFYSKGEKPKIIGTMDFDITFKIENAKTDLSERELTKTEFDLYEIKNAALKFEKENGRKAKVACMGLAFKPDIDDLRESPAVYVAKTLISQGIEVLAVEPNIESHKDFDIIDFETAINGADIIVFLVAHKEFKGIKIFGKDVIDFCGVNK